MKKVAIVSCYFKHNYGSMLQAYATQKILDDMNIENETINISKNEDFSRGKKKYYMSQITDFSFIKSKMGMIKLKLDKKLNKTLGKNLKIRDEKFKEFEKVFRLTTPYITYKQLTNACKEKYSSVIVGSDQLWLPVNVVADYYTLNFVPEGVKRISYATSFGVSEIPEKYKEKYVEFLNKVDYLSTREKKGVELIKNITGRDAELVCDPTLLLDKNQWMEIQDKERIIKDKYIFCYFLGKNIEHRKFVERLKEKNGYKIVSLNHCDEYVKYSDKFADITPYDVGPGEFVNLIRNAEYVCTDSFHGTVFSLINNVKFFTFERFKGSKMSTNSRIYSLLEIMDLKNRLLKGTEDVEEVINYNINFEIVNKKLINFRQSSKKFLENALRDSVGIQKKNNEIKYIQINDKSECCGCTACANVCPKNAIMMKEDEEGFLYPTIDKEKCINCGLCKTTCPIIKKKHKTKCAQKAYILNNKDDIVRSESTSGGTFTPIAKYVIRRNGAVFGAVIDEKNEVYHTWTKDEKELKRFRGSKYVQSNLKDSYSKVLEFLKNNEWVCFSGTPCQIQGVKSFLENQKCNTEKLVTVDVVCRAVPSPLVLRKYLNFQKRKMGMNNIDKVIFRDKEKYGYKYSTMTVQNNDKKYQQGVETDPYLRAFFKNYSDRPSCYQCKFRDKDRISDFTVWDCFTVGEFSKKLDDNKGTTRMIIQSKLGNEIFEEIKDEFVYEEIPLEIAIKNVRELKESPVENPSRNEFFEDINTMEESEFFNKYFADTIKVKLERNIRKVLVNTKFYNKMKNLLKKVIRKG